MTDMYPEDNELNEDVARFFLQKGINVYELTANIQFQKGSVPILKMCLEGAFEGLDKWNIYGKNIQIICEPAPDAPVFT